MKPLWTLALLACLGLVLGLGPAGAGGDKKKKDQGDQPAGENLDGTWQVVAVEVAGKKAADNDFKGAKLVIKGSAFTLTDGKQTTKGSFKADPTKTPKEVDSVFEDDA